MASMRSRIVPRSTRACRPLPFRDRVLIGASSIRKRTLVSHAKFFRKAAAKEKSGSLITAKLAADYNRDLLVVPGPIFSAESRGVHQFLKLGATPITSVEDLLQALGLAPREKRELLRGDVSDDEMRVIDVLASPVSRDELITALELPITDANILLSTMEIKGLIVEELGVVRVR